jgi:hypothetical protein
MTRLIALLISFGMVCSVWAARVTLADDDYIERAQTARSGESQRS